MLSIFPSRLIDLFSVVAVLHRDRSEVPDPFFGLRPLRHHNKPNGLTLAAALRQFSKLYLSPSSGRF